MDPYGTGRTITIYTDCARDTGMIYYDIRGIPIKVPESDPVLVPVPDRVKEEEFSVSLPYSGYDPITGIGLVDDILKRLGLDKWF